MKIIKTILIAVATGVVLLAGAATIFITTLSQDTIKNKVAQLVHDKTGRELKIAGNVSWTIYPWLGIKVQNVSLSNFPDFKNGDFGHARKFGIKVKLLPLFFERKIEADRFSLKDFDLQLITDSSGKNNWQDLLATKNTPNESSTTKNSNLAPTKLTINSVTIKNGTIFWQNQKTNQKIKIEKLNLSCKNAGVEHPFELKTSFYLANFSPLLDGEIEASAQTTLNIAKGLYVLNNFKLHTTNAIAIGSLQITHSSNAPNVSGKLTISDTGSKALTQLLGIQSKKQPITSFKVDLELSPQLIKLPVIKAKLDDMVLEGNANYTANTLAFDLALNKLDPSAFSNISFAAATSKTTTPTNTPTVASAKPSSATINSKPTTKTEPKFKPAANSPMINLNGNLKIGSMHYDKLNLTNLTTKIVGTPKLINCQDLGFYLYQKKVEGNASIDMHSTTTQVNLRLAVGSIPMQSLLGDLAGFEKFSGSLTLNTNLNLRGKTATEMFNSLSGNGNILITQGSYHGTDIPYEVRRVHAMLNAKPMPQTSSSPHTDFDRLTMSFNMNNALLNTNDLLIQSPDYKVTGKGSANLAASQLNFALSAYSMHDEKFFVPIKITGSFTKPSIKLDTAVMLQQEIKKQVINIIGKQADKYLPQDLKKILPLDKLLH